MTTSVMERSYLFAALNALADGTIIGRSMQRHRHQQFVRFLNAIQAQAPAQKAVPTPSSTMTLPTSIPRYANGWRVVSSLGVPLHAHIGVLSKCCRRLLCHAHEAAIKTRRLPALEPVDLEARDQSLRRRTQRRDLKPFRRTVDLTRLSRPLDEGTKASDFIDDMATTELKLTSVRASCVASA